MLGGSIYAWGERPFDGAKDSPLEKDGGGIGGEDVALLGNGGGPRLCIPLQGEDVVGLAVSSGGGTSGVVTREGRVWIWGRLQQWEVGPVGALPRELKLPYRVLTLSGLSPNPKLNPKLNRKLKPNPKGLLLTGVLSPATDQSIRGARIKVPATVWPH